MSLGRYLGQQVLAGYTPAPPHCCRLSGCGFSPIISQEVPSPPSLLSVFRSCFSAPRCLPVACSAGPMGPILLGALPPHTQAPYLCPWLTCWSPGPFDLYLLPPVPLSLSLFNILPFFLSSVTCATLGLSQRSYLSPHTSDGPGHIAMSLCPWSLWVGRWGCLWRRVYWLLHSSCRPVAVATRSEGPH